MTTDVAATLRRAKEEIKVRGWCKRTALDTGGRVCAIGALWFASGGKQEEWIKGEYNTIQDYIHDAIRNDEAAIYLASYLRKAPRPEGGHPFYTWTSQIWWWNDDAESVEEVLDGMEAAARKWELENA